jgi:two-component system OmpR family sensor kinase
VLSLTLATVVMWCLGAGYASYASYQQVSAAFDSALRQTALRILPLAADDAVSHEADDARDIARMMDSGAVHISYILSNASGKVLLREPWLPDLFAQRSGQQADHHHRRIDARPDRGAL